MSFALVASGREAITMAKVARPTTAPATGFVTARIVGHEKVVVAVQSAETVTGAWTKLEDTAAVERSPRRQSQRTSPVRLIVCDGISGIPEGQSCSQVSPS